MNNTITEIKNTLEEIDFKIKNIPRDKERHYTMIGISPRRCYNCEYLCSNFRSISIYKAKAKAIKGEINRNTIVVEGI